MNIKSAQGVDADPPVGPQLRFVEKSGTSVAAPLVTGVIALMLDKNPDLTTKEVRKWLTRTARPGVDPDSGTERARAYGSGMIDALKAHGETP